LRGLKENVIVGRLIPAGTGRVARARKHEETEVVGDSEAELAALLRANEPEESAEVVPSAGPEEESGE
jgi:hypothetical protein